jgi:DUF4097 and DUF4098 domain-containing protein YvlB
MKRPVIMTLLIVALVLVCMGIGAVAFFTLNNGFAGNNPFDRRNIPSTVEESKTLKVDTGKPVTLKVANASGDVTVTGSDVDTVQVNVVKTAYDSSQSSADAEVKNIKYTIKQTGNAITLTYELPKSMNFNNKVNTVDFEITVPSETAVEVDSSTGKVSVAGTKGNVDLKNSFGDVTVENIEGALSVSNNGGGIEATGIQAGSENIDLNSDFGNISLEKANAGKITINSNSGKVSFKDVNATGDFYSKSGFGDTKYENGSAASVTIDSNSGKVELIKVKAAGLIKVQDDFGDIKLTQATAGSYDLHSNSGTVTVDGMSNSLKASTDFGNIEVTNAQSATLDLLTKSGSVEFSGSLGIGPHQVNTDFGNITLVLPADSKLSVDLSTDFGNIKSELPVTITVTETSNSDGNQGDQIAGTINGGGEQLTVKSKSGNVTLQASK